jgi:hypothetical protein
MRHKSTRRDRRISNLFDRLEPRQMLANFQQTITDSDGDVFTIFANNFTTDPFPSPIVITSAADRVLTVSGSTATSDISISRTTQVGNGTLNLHSVTVDGDIDELVLDGFINVDDFGAAGDPGVAINGRARVVTINGTLRANLNISATGLNNRTTLLINTLEGGANNVNRGLLGVGTTIETGGIFESVFIGAGNLFDLRARRFGSVVVEDALPVLNFRGPPPFEVGLVFTIQSFDSGAPYGVKTVRLNCPVEDGLIFSPSPIQSVLYLRVTENPDIPGRGTINLGSLDIRAVGRVDSVRTTDGTMNGSLRASSFGSIQAENGLIGLIAGPDAPTRGGPIIDTFSIGSLRGQFADDLTVDCTTGISQIQFGVLDDVTINAGWIGSIFVTGIDGFSVVGTQINLAAETGQRSRALDTATFGRRMTNSSISIPQNNAGTVSITGGLETTNIFIGVATPANLFAGDPFGGATFTMTRLNMYQTPGQSVAGGGWISGNIAAPSISTVFSRVLIDTANGGTTFGLVFNSTTSMSFRRPDNGTIFTNTGSGFIVGDFQLRNI